jgi:RNA polymerase sigma factor (sigma-70 family)
LAISFWAYQTPWKGVGFVTDEAPIVFVVDDDASVRQALRRLLKSAGFQVRTFAAAEEFLEQSVSDATGCIVLDVQMPGLGGLDLQRRLAEKNASLPIVFLTGHGDIPMAVRAIRAGAVDFLAKPFDASHLLTSIRKAIAMHAKVRQTEAEVADIRQRAESLSPREREVMTLVVDGMANKETGSRLGVTEKTVKVHRARVMRKMQADSLAELVRLAEKVGIKPD